MKEQFRSCSEEDLGIAQLCILPLHQQTPMYGKRWRRSLENSWRRSVAKNAKQMLSSSDPPAKRINQSLSYLYSWEEYLGEKWMKDFDEFDAALSQVDTYLSSLSRSMSLVLEEFYSNILSVGVSSLT